MNYVQFISYNIVGGVLWIILFTMAGYFFGGRPEVEENFGLVIIAIIAISILPAVIEFIRHRRSLRNVTPVSE
jgi:membrane-associated protein